ncbi:MAG: T9SS type A sorting domain-containing protein, partial [Rhodothermia bacterium]
AYPNPFNPSTTIRFGIAEEGSVTLALFDVTGRRIQTLFEGSPEPNTMQQVRIDGAGLSSGLYVVRLESDTFVTSRTVALAK